MICITDADPTIKKNNKWASAFPFELDGSENCKPLSSHVEELKDKFEDIYNNISVYHPPVNYGKTLEYELCRENPTSPLLITDSFPIQNSAHTPENYQDIISKYDSNLDSITDEYKTKLSIDDFTKNRILDSISKCNWGDEAEKKKAVIAAIYYTIVSNAKGEHAFYLEQKLRDNLNKEGVEKLEFNIPSYIMDALNKTVSNDD